MKRGITVLAVLVGVLAMPTASAARELMAPAYRLGDAEPGGDLGSLSLADDTRPVLYAYPFVPIPETSIDWREVDGRRVARVALPDELAHARSLVVVATLIERKGTRAAPAQVVAVRAEDDTRSFDLTLPADLTTSGRIVLSASASPDASGREYESAPRPIPERARLEFGFGLLEVRTADGPVRFEVHACEQGGCKAIFTEVLDAEAKGFKDRAVSLAALSGVQASFRFRAEPVVAGTFFGLPVWSEPVVLAPHVAEAERHNVLLISLDTLAASHVGALGYVRDTTPFIDAWFGEGGTIFSQCFTAATTTGPSHMTLLTSLSPSVHGVHGGTYFGAIPEAVPTVARVFQRAGFVTGAVTEDGPMGAYRGFSRGFESYAENKGTSVGRTRGYVEKTLAAGRAWLERNRDKRFFLFLHTFQVHAPYAPPASYRKLFAGDGVGRELDERVPPKWRASLYDREIRYTDDVLRRFLGELTRDGLLDDTIVVLLSDHGEEFGEHGLLGHGAGIHDEVLRVPLMFRGPGIPAGRRVEAPVSHLDFTPTLLALAGIPEPHPGAGRSFAPLVVGAPGATGLGAREERPIFSEAWAEFTFRIAPGKLERLPVQVPILVVRQGSRKLVRYPGTPPTDVFYDLASDPGERAPRPATGSDTRDLRALIDAYVRETRTARDLLRGGGDRQQPGAPLDDARREKLRALGYLE